MTIGERIGQIRQSRFMTQEEFADKLGTTRQTVSRWELDQTYPELNKIVQISKVFSVSVDSILKDNISTFDVPVEKYPCGVYLGDTVEMVETESFVFVLYASADKNTLGAKLYYGFDKKKKLCAVAERNQKKNTTDFAFYAGEDEARHVFSTSDKLAAKLGSPFKAGDKLGLRRTQTFYVDHNATPLATVSEIGIAGCLERWRMSDEYTVRRDSLNFSLCTGKKEYFFNLRAKDASVYASAIKTAVSDEGVFAAKSYFLLRHRKSNEKSARFVCDFDASAAEIGASDEGYLYAVKSAYPTEITLQNKEGNEYVFPENKPVSERFIID